MGILLSCFSGNLIASILSTYKFEIELREHHELRVKCLWESVVSVLENLYSFSLSIYPKILPQRNILKKLLFSDKIGVENEVDSFMKSKNLPIASKPKLDSITKRK